MCEMLINQGAELLIKAGIDNAFWESRYIYNYIQRYSYYLQRKDGKKIEDLFFKFINQRRKRMPLAYLVYEWSCYKLDLHILDSVLVPRSDTEVLIDAIVNRFDKNIKYKFLDIGVGSGALLVNLLYYFSNSKGCGIDISLDAIRNTYINLYKYNLTAQLIHSNVSNLDDVFFEQFDIIVSNPPYINTNEKKYMNQETCYEPQEALFSDNYHVYYAIYNKLYAGFKSKKNEQKRDRFLYLEVSQFNYKYVYDLFGNIWSVNVIYDLQNYPRVLEVAL